MSDTHTSSSTNPWFSPYEVATFQKEDIATGKVVVLLMTSIFCLGILIYSIVLWSVL